MAKHHTRALDERKLDKRVVRESKTYNPYESPLHIDADTIPDDMEYAWIHDSILGQPDTSAMQTGMRRGYMPVTAEERPDLAYASTIVGDNEVYIRRNEQRLFSRPKSYREKEDNFLAERNKELMDSIPGREKFDREPTITMSTPINKTTRSFE